MVLHGLGANHDTELVLESVRKLAQRKARIVAKLAKPELHNDIRNLAAILRPRSHGLPAPHVLPHTGPRGVVLDAKIFRRVLSHAAPSRNARGDRQSIVCVVSWHHRLSRATEEIIAEVRARVPRSASFGMNGERFWRETIPLSMLIGTAWPEVRPSWRASDVDECRCMSWTKRSVLIIFMYPFEEGFAGFVLAHCAFAFVLDDCNFLLINLD
jgi:hypothetical protein